MKLVNNKANFQKITTLLKSQPGKDQLLKKDTFLSRYQHSDGYGVCHDNKLSSYLMLNIFKGRIYTKRIKIGAIGYLSANKNKTELLSLIRQALKDLHKKGILAVNISSAMEGLVNRLDFETTTEEKLYTFKSNALTGLEGKFRGKVKEGKWTDLLVQNGAAQLYEVPLHSTDERLTMNRDFWWWNAMDKDSPGRKLAVYFGPVGLPEAYMFYRLKNNNFFVQEMYGNKGEGIQGLLHFMLKQGNSKTVYHLILPAESHLEYLFSQENLAKIKITPLLLTRIIDFAQVLTCMKPIEKGVFKLAVKGDKLCPWNNGTWEIRTSDQGLEVKKSRQKPDFLGTIAAWTQVLLGELSLNDAVRFGSIKQNSEKKLHFEKGRISFFDRI